MKRVVRLQDGVARSCGRCRGRGVVVAAQGKVTCPDCGGHPNSFTRLTHHALPGRNRREKRLNAKAAQKAYLADRRGQS